MSIALACAGKSNAQGGMNVSQMAVLLQYFGKGKKKATAMSRQEIETTLCDVCRQQTVAAGMLQDLDYNGKDYLYKGVPGVIESISKIAAGAYGAVYKVTLSVGGQQRMFTHKVSVDKNSKGETEILEEIILLDQIPQFQTCKGLISIKRCSDNRSVIMPLALGTLWDLKGILTNDQLADIIVQLDATLECLRNKKIYYFDLKPGNILVGCNGENQISIYLADLGSMLPDLRGSHATTYPMIGDEPYTYPKRLSKLRIKRIHKFQLTLLYFIMHPAVPRDNGLTNPNPPYWALSKKDRKQIIWSVMAHLPADVSMLIDDYMVDDNMVLPDYMSYGMEE